MLCGCSRTAAAEFTFFLAIPVMFGWGLVKAVKFVLNGLAMTQTEIMVLAVGVVTAFRGVGRVHQVPDGLHQEERLHGVRRGTASSSALPVLGYFAFESMGMLP